MPNSWELWEAMGTASKINVLIKFSPKRKGMLGVINENIEVSIDNGNDVFEKMIALSTEADLGLLQHPRWSAL